MVRQFVVYTREWARALPACRGVKIGILLSKPENGSGSYPPGTARRTVGEACPYCRGIRLGNLLSIIETGCEHCPPVIIYFPPRALGLLPKRRKCCIIDVKYITLNYMRENTAAAFVPSTGPSAKPVFFAEKG